MPLPQEDPGLGLDGLFLAVWPFQPPSASLLRVTSSSSLFGLWQALHKELGQVLLSQSQV